MLKISVVKKKNTLTLQLEGRLAEPLVKEAERSWQTLYQGNTGYPIQVDLCSVTFIDQSGKMFLKQVHLNGGQLIASGCLNQSCIDEIIRKN